MPVTIPPTIISTALDYTIPNDASGVVGILYDSAPVTVAGSPVMTMTVIAGALPGGMFINGPDATGSNWNFHVSGIPTLGGGMVVAGGESYTGTFQVSNSGGNTSQAFNFFIGDPHFTSFRGEQFDFHGESNKIYNLYSDKYVQVNALFVYWATSGAANWTSIQEMGIKFGSTKIKIDALTQKITVNDIPIEHTNFQFVWYVDKIPEKYEIIKKQKGFEKFVSGAMIKFFNYEYFIAFTTDNVNPICINLAQNVSDEIDAHGVIGQTAMYHGEPRVCTGSNGEGIIEGVYQNYEVSDLFADDFKFNKWRPVVDFITKVA